MPKMCFTYKIEHVIHTVYLHVQLCSLNDIGKSVYIPVCVYVCFLCHFFIVINFWPFSSIQKVLNGSLLYFSCILSSCSYVLL